MALTLLSFSRQGDRWVSGEFTSSTSNIAIGIKYPLGSVPGADVIEYSIDGDNWVQVGEIVGISNRDSWYVAQHVSGFVPGVKFRIITSREPESIKILE
jgi:hypothetical protein